MESTLMMTLDYVGDRVAMAYAQVGQHPLARATETVTRCIAVAKLIKLCLN